jgi:hypothetical protein
LIADNALQFLIIVKQLMQSSNMVPELAALAAASVGKLIYLKGKVALVVNNRCMARRSLCCAFDYQERIYVIEPDLTPDIRHPRSHGWRCPLRIGC